MLAHCSLCGRLANPRSKRILDWGLAPWMGDCHFICPRHLARTGATEAQKAYCWRMVYVRLARSSLTGKAP
jgi:hypothetical protein